MEIYLAIFPYELLMTRQKTIVQGFNIVMWCSLWKHFIQNSRLWIEVRVLLANKSYNIYSFETQITAFRPNISYNLFSTSESLASSNKSTYNAEIAFQTITSCAALDDVFDAHRFRQPVQTERTLLSVIFVLPHKRPWNDSPERRHVAVCSNRYLDGDRFRVCSTPKRSRNVYLSSNIDRPSGRCSAVPPCRRDVIYFWNRGWVDSGDWNGWRNAWRRTDVCRVKGRLNFFLRSEVVLLRKRLYFLTLETARGS